MPVFKETLRELKLLAEVGSPLSLVGFSLELRESPVLEQAPMKSENISEESPEEEPA